MYSALNVQYAIWNECLVLIWSYYLLIRSKFNEFWYNYFNQKYIRNSVIITIYLAQNQHILNMAMIMLAHKKENKCTVLLRTEISVPNRNICMRRKHTRVGTLIVATIYLQLKQNRYMFRSFTVLQCSHQHCVQPVASDVEVVRYL